MAAVRVIDDLFLATTLPLLLLLLCSLWRLSAKSNATTNPLIAEKAGRRLVLEHSRELNVDHLQPASTPHSSFQLTFACPTPAYQSPPERAPKQYKTTNSIRLTIKKVSRHIPSKTQCIGNRPFRSSQSDCIRVGVSKPGTQSHGIS